MKVWQGCPRHAGAVAGVQEYVQAKTYENKTNFLMNLELVSKNFTEMQLTCRNTASIEGQICPK